MVTATTYSLMGLCTAFSLLNQLSFVASIQYEDDCDYNEFYQFYVVSSAGEWVDYDNQFIFGQCALEMQPFGQEISVQQVSCYDDCEESQLGQGIPAPLPMRQCWSFEGVDDPYYYEVICDAKNFMLDAHYHTPGTQEM